MLGLRRHREPEPAAPAPHPRPAVDGGLLRRFDPPPAAARHLEATAASGPAILEELAAEFADRPWRGDGYGEFVVVSPEPPPPPSDGGLVIEPPPWQDALEAGGLDLAAALAPPAPVSRPPAITELMLQDAEWPDLQLEAVHIAPIRYEPPPAPDWEAEERDRLARERAEREQAAQLARAELLRELLAESENEQAYPKPKRPATQERDR